MQAINRFPLESPSWGYCRIQGELKDGAGSTIVVAHAGVAAADFFTTEVCSRNTLTIKTGTPPAPR